MEDARRSGFSLLELLVTLALVATLVSVAVPAMGRLLDKARLRSAAQALAQDLREARNYALSHQQNVYFSLSISPQQWCYGWSEFAVCDCGAGNAAADACRTGDPPRGQLHRQLSTDFPSVRLNTTRPVPVRTLLFSPVRGTASADSFALRNAAGELRVIVSPLGRVRICSSKGRGYAKC